MHNHFPTSQVSVSGSYVDRIRIAISFSKIFYSRNQPVGRIQSSLSPEALSWTVSLIDVQLTTTFHRRLLYTFGTRGIPFCPLMSSAVCDSTLKRAPVFNKGHCLTGIGMLLWTTGICYKGSLSLCLVHHSGPPGVLSG